MPCLVRREGVRFWGLRLSLPSPPSPPFFRTFRKTSRMRRIGLPQESPSLIKRKLSNSTICQHEKSAVKPLSIDKATDICGLPKGQQWFNSGTSLQHTLFTRLLQIWSILTVVRLCPIGYRPHLSEAHASDQVFPKRQNLPFFLRWSKCNNLVNSVQKRDFPLSNRHQQELA